MNINQETGLIIRQHRRSRGLTQGILADVLNITQSAYAKIENGYTPLDVSRILILAKFYKLSVNELIPQFYWENDVENTEVESEKIDFRDLLKVKDQLIEHLQEEIEYLRKNR